MRICQNECQQTVPKLTDEDRNRIRCGCHVIPVEREYEMRIPYKYSFEKWKRGCVGEFTPEKLEPSKAEYAALAAAPVLLALASIFINIY